VPYPMRAAARRCFACFTDSTILGTSRDACWLGALCVCVAVMRMFFAGFRVHFQPAG
jgi:hypothetical protein